MLHRLKKMQIKIYELEKEGLEFKKDFNRFIRIMKIRHEIKNNQYEKIDLLTDKSKNVFLCTRHANFTEKLLVMQIKKIGNILYLNNKELEKFKQEQN